MSNDVLISEADKLEAIWARAAQRLAPPPSLKTSEWAERHRYLTTDISSRPGRWSNDNAPYLVEPMDVEQNEPWIDTIAMQKASRMGGTEVVNNKIARRIHYDPCPILYVQQSHDEAQKYSDTILQAMLDNCPPVEDLLTVDNTFFKRFPGGNLHIAGAQTPKAFRMLEKEIVVVDDIDGFPTSVGEEGDPITLAFKRCANNPNRLKIPISSPTLKGYSPIENIVLTSDQRRWHVPCPLCGHEQVLKFGGPEFNFGLKWKNRDPATAYYMCEKCHGKIQHFQKFDMNLQGRWIKTAKPLTPNIAGFYFSQMFSNFVTWSDIVTEWLAAFKDPAKLQVFFNTTLGETFEDKAEKIEHHALKARLEEYGPLVPAAAWVLTAFTDVQHDRLETKIVAWGPELEAWVLEYKVLEGDPLLPAVWKECEKYILRPREHESGLKLKVAAAGWDSGYLTDRVYEFVRPRKHLNFIATKGANILGKPVMAERSSKNIWKDKKVHLYEIGADAAKTSIHRRLLQSTPGPAYIHFHENPPPGCQPLDDYYFTGLTAEKRINTSKNRARPKLEWRLRERGLHNEPLDLMVGNLAILHWLMQFTDFSLAGICEKMNRKAQNMEQGVIRGPGAPQAASKARRVRRKGITIEEIMGKK